TARPPPARPRQSPSRPVAESHRASCASSSSVVSTTVRAASIRTIVLTCQAMATTTERRTRSDGERSRQTILRAAANLATVEGLEGLSIGNLAAHIGMSKSGLYAHFGSKEELQLATVDTAGKILAAEVVEPTEAIADPLERLQTLLDRFLGYVERGVFQGG